MDQPGLIGLFDFVGYFAALGTPSRHGASFGLSIHDVFFMYREAEQRQRAAEQEVIKIHRILNAHAEAVYTKRYNEWLDSWASTYTVLLSEL